MSPAPGQGGPGVPPDGDGSAEGLDVVVRDAGGPVTRYRLAVGDILSLGRGELIPDDLLADLINDDQGYRGGYLASRWPHLLGRDESLRRHALGSSGAGRHDSAVSEHALVVFWGPAQGWLTVNCSGSGKTWETQRWTHPPVAMTVGQAVAVEDRLAVWIASDHVRKHCLVMSQDGTARREQEHRVPPVAQPTGTTHGPTPVTLTQHQRLAFVRLFEQFLRWDPPHPQPRVTPNRRADYLRAVPEGSADNSTLKTAVEAAARRNDFLPNGAGGSPKDNTHFIHRVLHDEAELQRALMAQTDPLGNRKTAPQLAADRQSASELLTFDTVQDMLRQLDEKTGGFLRP